MDDAPVIQTVPSVDPADLLDLYESVGWKAYTRDPEGLATAVANSTYIVEARAKGELIGLARGLSDDVSIFYLQDILVRPEWQRRGVGKSLMLNCLERFSHVRSKVLLTDDLPSQHRFYEAMGYKDTRNISDENLHTFVWIEELTG